VGISLAVTVDAGHLVESVQAWHLPKGWFEARTDL